MIPNVGADAMWWEYYYGVSGSQVASLLQETGAFLISIQPTDASGSAFNIIMEQSPGVSWSWTYDMSAADLTAKLLQTGDRLLDVKAYFVNGATHFAAVMVQNTISSPPTPRR